MNKGDSLPSFIEHMFWGRKDTTFRFRGLGGPMAKTSNVGGLVQSLVRELDPTCYSEDRRSCVPYAMKDSVQSSSVAQSCLTLCDPMNRSTPGLPVHHKLPQFTERLGAPK